MLVRSIGAGGGSIAWVDDGGLLRVGPQSAGSNPGPACYGRGGNEPTVTDADLLLGHLDADSFLGGRMALRRDLARAALQRVGDRLGMSAEEVAIGVSRIVNAHMADLIRRSTIELGHDPRECVLVAYGGAGPTHAAAYAADIGARSIIVPADSTVFSAEGILTCDLTHTEDASWLVPAPFDEAALGGVAERMAVLEKRVLDQFAAEDVSPDDVTLTHSVGMRFGEQFHSLAVSFDRATAGEPGAGEALVGAFVERYGRLYGEGAVLLPDSIVLELHRVIGTYAVEPLRLASGGESHGADAVGAMSGKRSAYVDGAGFLDVPVYHGDLLRWGNVVSGPAIIERMGDSVLVPAECRAAVDELLNISLVQSTRDGAPTP